jgi:hypothetical protein
MVSSGSGAYWKYGIWMKSYSSNYGFWSEVGVLEGYSLSENNWIFGFLYIQ